MTPITIPRRMAARDDLVVIPRGEYQALLQWRKVREFKPTASQKKALARAERNYRLGKTLSYNELTRKLGLTG